MLLRKVDPMVYKQELILAREVAHRALQVSQEASLSIGQIYVTTFQVYSEPDCITMLL